MDEEKYQKELFEFEKPRKRFPRFSDLFPKADFDNRVAITLTLERLIMIAIGLLMLAVVVYAFGIETGRRITKDAASSETRITLTKTPVMQPKIRPPAPVTVMVPEKLAANRPYSIFAASFTRQDYAAQAVNKLKGAGFGAFLSQVGTSYRLCIGTSKTKDEAKGDLIKIKRIYKDAYVKVR